MGSDLFFNQFCPRKNKSDPILSILDLGLIDYPVALEYQRSVFAGVKSGARNSTLILCQHDPVITLGRQANKKNILVSQDELLKKRISVFEIERGGDITYHGPGQLMAYPIFNLNHFKKDIHFFLRGLEEAVIDLLSDYGITAVRRPGLTGVWVGNRKISSIGIAIRNWITFHGLSINIHNEDMSNYRLIRPCGMDIEMVSLEALLGRQVEISSLKVGLAEKFLNVFLGAPNSIG
jgi:lipoate-protein ligase B